MPIPPSAGVRRGIRSPLSRDKSAQVRAVAPNTLLIPGTTSIAHLEHNLAAKDLQLTADDLTVITTAVDQSGVEVWRPTR